MLTALHVFAGLVLIFLAFLVALNDRKRMVNISFFAFLIVSCVWLGANLAVNISSSGGAALLSTKITVSASILMALMFVFFVEAYRQHIQPKILTCGLWLLTLLLMVMSFTYWVVKDVTPKGLEISFGKGYYLIIATIILFFGYGCYKLLQAYREATGLARAKAYYVLTGITITFIVGLILSGILPIAGISQAASYGALTVLIFACFAAVSIVRYKLFDIRVIIARSIAYVLAITTLSAVFMTSSLLITNIFFKLDFSPAYLLYSIALSTVLALLFQPVKKSFDKLTDRLFYRDNYDAQELMAQFSRYLVAEIRTDSVIKFTSKILNQSVKPSSAFIFLYEKSENVWHNLAGTLPEDIKTKLNKTLEYQRPTILQIEGSALQLAEDEAFTENIHQLLENERMALSIKLSTKDQLVGFLLLGVKHSGNLYSARDLDFLSILTNGLSVALQNAQRFEEIQRFNETLQQKIEGATKELRSSNEKLKALDEAKDEFISMASHQLRTPLTSVKGYLSMVMEGDAGRISAKQREMLQAAFFSSQRMVFLISDLLNVSRLKTGKFVIEYSVFDLAEVVDSEVAQLREVAASRGLELTYDKPPQGLMVKLDENKIRQVIMNFIDNAIYYSKTGGKIEVHLESDEKSIRYWVQDYGIGVPKRDQHKLFTKFFRGSNARRARPDGTGLGLFMSQKALIAQGGATIFKSVQDKGSTFGFTFPRSKIEVK